MVTPLGYSLEIYVNVSVENPLGIFMFPTHKSGLLLLNVSSMYHVSGTSYTNIHAHEEGPPQFFNMDDHHYDESCAPDDVVSEASDELNSEGDRRTTKNRFMPKSRSI